MARFPSRGGHRPPPFGYPISRSGKGGGLRDVHIFLVAGQSNSSGRAPDLTGTGYPAGTMEWRDSAWAEIGPRLYHGTVEDGMLDYYPDTGANFGFDRSFAAAYRALNPDADVYLVGAGAGGTGFVNGDWADGGDKRQICFDRMTAALASAPAGALFKGVLWNQGENDGQSASGRASYLTNLSAFISDFRAQIADVPFVVAGQMFRGSYYNSVIQNVVQALPNLLDRVGYADISSPTEGVHDEVYADNAAHYSTVTTDNLGAQYVAGFTEALGGLPSGSGAITVGAAAVYDLPDLTATGVAQTVSGLDLGAEAADRRIVIAVMHRDSAYGLSYCKTVKIGDVAFERLGTPAGEDRMCNVSWFSASMPTGTTGDLDLEFTDFTSLSGGAVYVVPVYGARAHIANANGMSFASGGAGFGSSLTSAVDVASGDLILSASACLSPDIGTGVLDLDNSASEQVSGSNVGFTHGYEIANATAQGRAVMWTADNATNNYGYLATVVLTPA